MNQEPEMKIATAQNAGTLWPTRMMVRNVQNVVGVMKKNEAV